MATSILPYKGKHVEIERREDRATVRVDGIKFECALHTGGPLGLWHCNHAYFATPDLRELARHFVDFLYVYQDPNTAPPPVESPEHTLPGHPGAHPPHFHVEAEFMQPARATSEPDDASGTSA